MRKLELLAPARNLECGKAAIDHGADAVYIGALRFGARAAAGNSLDDIRQLCDYAHLFGAKVYVTVNTILYDDELEATEHLIWELYNINVDAILVQDMAIFSMNLPPIAIHASTQMDNRTDEKVQYLHKSGIKRVVLARELSITEISHIHTVVPDVELEVFVHGALCVSYSGQCYASQYCFGRSANRGECAQFCRLPFTLTDGNGNIIERERHLLSLRDMKQLDNLERLAESGAVSFKIEGRLKDADYVKNVVAAYSERLNNIIVKHNRNNDKDVWQRASCGKCEYTFIPNVEKSFNRGFTTYFADGRDKNIASFDTPKAIGEYVGNVKEIRLARRGEGTPSFNVAGTASFSNGDGLCFFDENRNLVGFRVNRAEGNRLFPHQMPNNLKAGTPLYRNYDHQFTTLLAHNSAKRRLWIDMELNDLTLSATDEMGRSAQVSLTLERQIAQKPQAENIRKQLSKLGNTIFEVRTVDVQDDYPYFIPSSVLSEARRRLVEAIGDVHIKEKKEKCDASSACHPIVCTIPYLYNAANRNSREYYEKYGIKADCFEKPIYGNNERPLLMQCRYCLRDAMGLCLKKGGGKLLPEPLKLSLSDGKNFTLSFNCNKCEMYVYADTNL